MFAFPPRDDFDHRLVRALDHPIRVRFLELLRVHDSLPTGQALPLLRNPALTLAHIAYHARVLLQLELIEASGHRETEETAFRTTARGEVALEILGALPREEGPHV